MQIIEIKNSDKEKWNNFVLAQKGEFLQSWEWGEFQKFAGRQIWRLAVTSENDEFLAVAMVIKNNLPLGKNYLYCPRGPIIGKLKVESKKLKFLELIFDKINKIARKENSIFLKLELPINNNVIASPEYSGRGNPAVNAIASDFLLGNPVSKSVNLQPHDSLILDLNKSEEELLAQMKQKTRYNIRLAEKHGIKVRMSAEKTFESDFEKFWALTEETTSRDKFQSHAKEYYFKMLALRSLNEGGLETLNGEIAPQRLDARLYLAEFEGKIIAANIMVFFGDRATYLHGASGSEYRNLMAPYLLQWEQIKKSRAFGFKEYDFWGIASKNQKPKTKNQNLNAVNYKAEWEGITRFKTGFGGREINYPDAVDILYQPMVYKAIRVAKKIKAVLK